MCYHVRNGSGGVGTRTQDEEHEIKERPASLSGTMSSAVTATRKKRNTTADIESPGNVVFFWDDTVSTLNEFARGSQHATYRLQQLNSRNTVFDQRLDTLTHLAGPVFVTPCCIVRCYSKRRVGESRQRKRKGKGALISSHPSQTAHPTRPVRSFRTSRVVIQVSWSHLLPDCRPRCPERVLG